MEPIRALIFGIDDLFPQLKPYYDHEVEKGNLEIVGYAIFKDNTVHLLKNLEGEPFSNKAIIDFILVSSHRNYMSIFKLIKSIWKNIMLKNVIDGRIFKVPGFDFERFINERIVHGKIAGNIFGDLTTTIYPKVFNMINSKVYLGRKSYVSRVLIEGKGLITIGDFSSIAWDNIFELHLNLNHNPYRVCSFDLSWFDWLVPRQFNQEVTTATLNIGSDVWIGRGCKFKTSNPNKPLIIGNGAVVAADSVVVKDVPPFAIVGGNPAKFIKWRFEPEIIEALERIAWWNWDLEKIYDNFHLFNDPKEFVKKFDPQG